MHSKVTLYASYAHCFLPIAFVLRLRSVFTECSVFTKLRASFTDSERTICSAVINSLYSNNLYHPFTIQSVFTYHLFTNALHVPLFKINLQFKSSFAYCVFFICPHASGIILRLYTIFYLSTAVYSQILNIINHRFFLQTTEEVMAIANIDNTKSTKIRHLKNVNMQAVLLTMNHHTHIPSSSNKRCQITLG